MQADLCQKSDLTWRLASAHLVAGDFNSAASRFYYSVIQSVKAYFVASGQMNMKESGRMVGGRHQSIHSWAEEVVLNAMLGSIPLNFGRLRSLRIKADYYPESVDEASLRSLLNDAEQVRYHFKQLVARIAAGKP